MVGFNVLAASFTTLDALLCATTPHNHAIIFHLEVGDGTFSVN